MDDERILPCRVWKFILVKSIESGVKPQLQVPISSTIRGNTLPPHEQDTCCSCTHHGTETEKSDEDYGTMVIEVTTVTKTTRKKYRVTEG